MKKNLLFLLSLVLSVACSESLNDADTTTQKVFVNFTNGGIQFTRVTNSQFDNGDEIKVKAFASGSEYDEEIYTYTSSNFASITPFELIDGLLLSYNAVYPSDATFSGIFEVNTDQSNTDSYEASDLLVATVAENNSSTPELVFNHVLSSIVLNVKIEENGVAKSGLSVETTFNLKNQIDIDVASESYIATGNTTSITPYPSVGNGQSDTYNYSTIVAPQTVAANAIIASVVVDGADQFYFTQSTDLTLLSSKQHIYTFTVDIVTKETSIEFGGVINDWDSVEFDDSNEATATMMLASLSADSYPTTATSWIIEDETAELSNFDGLKAALNNCEYGSVSLSFPNLKVVPDGDMSTFGSSNILSGAFLECYSVGQIYLPVATYIGEGAFAYCPELSVIDAPEASFIGDCAFVCTGMNCTELQLPKVTEVGDYAFMMSSWSSIELPIAQSVGDDAFEGCQTMTSISLPEVTSVGDWAFVNCDNLTTIELSSLIQIGRSVFMGCSNLREVLTGGNFVYESGILFNADKSKVVTTAPAIISGEISLEATYIEDYAFEECRDVTSLNLPNAIYLGEGAFISCYSVKEINIPRVSFVKDKAFYACFDLTTIELPQVTEIGYCAFDFCSKLTKLSFATDNGVKLSFINENAMGVSSSYYANSANIALTIGSSNKEYVSDNTLTIDDFSQTFKEIIIVD